MTARVLFWMPTASDIPGGHVIQMRQTALAVERAGALVSVSTEPRPDLSCVDVVHGFGLRAADVRMARSAGCRVAISTIYWPVRYSQDAGIARRVLAAAQARSRQAVVSAQAALRGKHYERAERILAPSIGFRLAFESADVLLPNAAGELTDIRKDLGVTTPAVVVPNAIDARVFLSSRPAVGERHGVLCVGRLEPHKNQLGLARACNQLGLPLTLVGDEHPHHLGYGRACESEMPSVRWIRHMDQASLVDVYDAARVHALPSWFETTGLSNLEAAARGCSIVSTDRGYAQEYFGNYASYCNPASTTSVADAIKSALEPTTSDSLRASIEARYTWDRAAQVTLSAYRLAGVKC